MSSKSTKTATLSAVVEGFLNHLEQADKSPGTCFSYGQDLALALEYFGAETPIAAITQKRVAEYFASDGLRKKQNGRVKSKITIDKTKRVFRLACDWAVEKKIIAESPIPADERPTRGAGKAEDKKPAKDSSKPARASSKNGTRKAAKASDATAPVPTMGATAEAPATATPAE